MRVLVVEDSDIVRRSLRELILRIEDVEVVAEAIDAVEAVEAARTFKPDVMTVDIQMPRGSGIDVLRTVKLESPSTVVIMLTNYPYPQFRRACASLGADYFFDKATEFEKIVDVVRTARRTDGNTLTRKFGVNGPSPAASACSHSSSLDCG